MRKSGFTLIELIVVIAIIAVLAAIIAPNAFKAIEKAKISATIADVQAIKTGAMSSYSDTGVWVASCTTVAACGDSLFIENGANGVVTTPATTATAGWDGPYIEKWPPQSKWAGIYTYTSAAGTEFHTTSAGERYVSITVVPTTAYDRIDMQMDGAVGTGTGSVQQLAATATTLISLISRDGPTL
jgi:general secretion pathway protein G